MTENSSPSPSRVKVAVLTMTYNHAPFIRQHIASVLEQVVDFPLEHIIVDDFSTDGTREIVADLAARHPHIKAILLERKSWHGENVRALFSNCHAPYAAMCDGDDYFTDPHKLRIQATFLDDHPDHALCFHPVHVRYDDGSGRSRTYPPLESLPRGMKPSYHLADLMKGNFIQTNSVMYRWRFRDGLPDWFDTTLIPGDWYWHLLHAECGKIGFINKLMSVYRRHANALFYSAEGSSIEHRLKFWYEELRFYGVVNKHYSGRYERSLLQFTNSVFSDLFNYCITINDFSLLTMAQAAFPKFARHFFSGLKLIPPSC